MADYYGWRDSVTLMDYLYKRLHRLHYLPSLLENVVLRVPTKL
jgi:hypothetical protein